MMTLVCSIENDPATRLEFRSAWSRRLWQSASWFDSGFGPSLGWVSVLFREQNEREITKTKRSLSPDPPQMPRAPGCTPRRGGRDYGDLHLVRFDAIDLSCRSLRRPPVTTAKRRNPRRFPFASREP